MPLPDLARPSAPARARRAVLTAALAAVLAVGPALGLAAASAAGAPSAVPTDAPPVVLIGTTGLRWDDLGSLTTPALWTLSREGAVGTVAARSIRTSACPADGWLAVSAGNRAGDLLVEDGTCRRLREPMPGSAVPGWADYVESAELESYDARLGMLGDTLLEGGAQVVGIGPGAAIALAGSDGVPVGEHLASPVDPDDLERRAEDALETADLLVVDVGSVRDPGYATRSRPASDPALAGEAVDPSLDEVRGTDAVTEPTRGEQAQAIDARVRAVLDAVDDSRTGATVLVVSLADSRRKATLQLAAATGPVVTGEGTYTDAFLVSGSTRQPGYVQATDVTPTLLTGLGLRDVAPSGVVVGAPMLTAGGLALASERVAALIDANRHALATQPLMGQVYLVLVGINLVLYALVSVGLNGRVLDWLRRTVARRWPGRGRRLVAATTRPGAVLRQLRIAGVAVATYPVATFLANLSPWWRASTPSYALAALVVAWITVLTALALLPRWGRWPLGPLGVVAAVTAVVLTVDVATGARLQLAAVMGVLPQVAGRFYGFNNTAFSLFAAASILLTVAITNPLVAHGRRRLAAGVVAVVGVVATVLDGLPSIGADFGGPPALVPGFAVLAILAAGVRLTWWRTLAVLAAGALTVTSFAVLDWLRPADSRTHLGRFVATVLDGGLMPVVTRKLEQNLNNLVGSELTLLAAGGLLLLLLVLGRPVRTAVGAPDGGAYGWLSSGAPLTRLGTDAPMLRPGLVALAVTLGIGFALNDSGVLIPAMGGALAVPLLVAACASWMLTLSPGAPEAAGSAGAGSAGADGTTDGDGSVDGPGAAPAGGRTAGDGTVGDEAAAHGAGAGPADLSGASEGAAARG
ncbi:hypothetical protein [Cellulomonas cellasea]|uniref:Uncharacterized protein n=2 Tax=Cellulomonas cellasea TaxID=43670 RepID=A0A4Y3KTA7_9CELL|nr:hypothetical protein [Cellulomonas cellasea]GEA87659.1 hypothetical protein CCE01nite_16080 [Cellulomonas cellasea]